MNSDLAEMNIGPETRQKVDAQRIKLTAMRVPAEVRPSVARSFVAGFRLVMLINAGLALGGAATACWMIRDTE